MFLKLKSSISTIYFYIRWDFLGKNKGKKKAKFNYLLFLKYTTYMLLPYFLAAI